MEQWLPDFLTTHTPVPEIAVRIVMALIFGGAVGLERELRNRPAGLRTHMIVSMAAAIFVLTANELYYALAAQFSGTPAIDPLRTIEAVVAGVAFLGAGSIIRGDPEGGRKGSTVRGITTGATLWLAGAIGLACGGGFYVIAVLAVVFSLLVLRLVGWAEHRWVPEEDDANS